MLRYNKFAHVTCFNCGVSEPQDYMVLADVGDGNIHYVHVKDEGRCFEIEDGEKVYVDTNGILRDECPVNSLLQKDDRISTAFNEFARTSAIIFVLLWLGAMLALSLPPDERLSVRVGNDAGWVK